MKATVLATASAALLSSRELISTMGLNEIPEAVWIGVWGLGLLALAGTFSAVRGRGAASHAAEHEFAGADNLRDERGAMIGTGI